MSELNIYKGGRHVIEPGSKILGGVLLCRAAIAADYDTERQLYYDVYVKIDDELGYEPVLSALSIAVAVKKVVREVMAYDSEEVGEILKHEARSRGVSRLGLNDEVGLSRFIKEGVGTCQQLSLLTAAMLQLLQERRVIGCNIALSPHQQYGKINPDRNIVAHFYSGTEGVKIDTYADRISFL